MRMRRTLILSFHSMEVVLFLMIFGNGRGYLYVQSYVPVPNYENSARFQRLFPEEFEIHQGPSLIKHEVFSAQNTLYTLLNNLIRISGCWEKKLNDYGWCEKCGELQDEGTKACLAAFNYVTDSSESPTKVTLFKSTLSTLLRDDVDLTSEEAFVTQIANALPICFKCEIREGKFYNISLQRSAINDR